MGVKRDANIKEFMTEAQRIFGPFSFILKRNIKWYERDARTIAKLQTGGLPTLNFRINGNGDEDDTADYRGIIVKIGLPQKVMVAIIPWQRCTFLCEQKGTQKITGWGFLHLAALRSD